MPHSCGFCGKEFPSRGSVKKHIAIRPECRRKWESLVEDTDDEGGLPVDFSYDNSFSPLCRSHSKSFDSDEDNPAASKSWWVTVEDVADEDKDNLIINNRRYFEQCPDASWTLQEGQTGFENYRQYKEDKGEDKWAPFCNMCESSYVHCVCKTINFRHHGRM